MAFEVFNSILYIFSLIFYWRKYDSFDTYFVLMTAFAFTAIMGVCFQASGDSPYHHTSLLPYLYLYVCICICFKPYEGFRLEKKLYIKETILIKLLTWVYIVAGLFAFYYTLPNALLLLQSGEWGELRNQLYQGDDIELYSSQTERLAKNVFSYLSPFGIVMAFYQLTKTDRKWYVVFLLFSTWLGNTFLSATLVASRGIVAILLLRIGLILILFKDSIPAKVKKRFVYMAGIVSIPAVIYLMAVSVSRFGEDEAGSSIFFYLGHAMQNFNENCMMPMYDFAWGGFAFSYFAGIFGWHPLNLEGLGYTGGSGFFTFLGAFYMALGPVFTLLFCIILSSIIASFTRKKTKSFSDLIIIVYFASFFMNGVFVIGNGYALQWIMVFIVYYIVKFSEKTI